MKTLKSFIVESLGGNKFNSQKKLDSRKFDKWKKMSHGMYMFTFEESEDGNQDYIYLTQDDKPVHIGTYDWAEGILYFDNNQKF